MSGPSFTLPAACPTGVAFTGVVCLLGVFPLDTREDLFLGMLSDCLVSSLAAPLLAGLAEPTLDGTELWDAVPSLFFPCILFPFPCTPFCRSCPLGGSPLAIVLLPCVGVVWPTWLLSLLEGVTSELFLGPLPLRRTVGAVHPSENEELPFPDLPALWAWLLGNAFTGCGLLHPSENEELPDLPALWAWPLGNAFTGCDLLHPSENEELPFHDMPALWAWPLGRAFTGFDLLLFVSLDQPNFGFTIPLPNGFKEDLVLTGCLPESAWEEKLLLRLDEEEFLWLANVSLRFCGQVEDVLEVEDDELLRRVRGIPNPGGRRALFLPACIEQTKCT